MYKIITAFLLIAYCIQMSWVKIVDEDLLLKMEMDALEKELEAEHKSLSNPEKDVVIPSVMKKEDKKVDRLSTLQLVEELKKEINSISKPRAYHETSKDSFDEILNGIQKDKENEFWKKTVNSMFEDVAKKETEIECSDARQDCKSIAEYCNVKQYRKQMEKRCLKTCGFCPIKCIDKSDTCPQLVSMKFCETSDKAMRARMMETCPKSCGVCSQHAPPKCSASAHGCCWDKTTTKNDASGTNCPACLNQYKYVCKRFAPDCKEINRAAGFMYKHCPQTCGICNDTCRDKKSHEQICPFWKKDLKWCEEKKDIMKHYCPKTCAYC